MKKIFNIASAVLALVAVACNKYEISDNGHESGQPDVEGCYNVYFPTQEASGDHTFDPTQTPVVEFTVVRANARGAITVPYNVQASTENVFQCGDIKFENGQDTTKLVVDFSKAEIGTKYSLSLSISDPKYASYYTSNARDIDFSVMRVEWKYVLNPKTNEPAKVTFTQTWWDETATGKIKYYEVGDIRYCQTETDEIHVSSDGPYKGYGFFGTAKKPEDAVEWEFQWFFKSKNAKDLNYIQIGNDGTQATGYTHSQIGPITTCDYYGWWLVLNPQASLAGTDFLTFAKKYEGSYPVSYYDGNGGFVLCTAYYVSADLQGWQNSGDPDVLCVVEGYDRSDYEIYKITADYPVNGKQLIEVETGKTAQKIKYACAEGELTATQAGKLAETIQKDKAAKVAETPFYDEEADRNYFDIEVSFDKTGTYTIVALSNPTDSTYEFNFKSFDYVSSADADSLKVKLTVGTEPVPERYGYTSYEAFSYFIMGEDLKDVHYAVLPKKTYDAGEAGMYEYLVKLADNDTYGTLLTANVATEEQLAQINARGGFTSIVSGCSALTEYIVVVWATNGHQDITKTAVHKTDGLPLESIGKGTYTYNAFYEGDTPDLELCFDPNTNMYLIDDYLGGGYPFKFTWDKTTDKLSVPALQIAEVTSNYGTLYFGDVLDAINKIYGSNAQAAIAFYESAGLEINSIADKSHYDPATSTFHFALWYECAAGYVASGIETFVLDQTKASANSVRTCAPAARNTTSFAKSFPVKNLPAVNAVKVSTKAIEREPSIVRMESSAVPYTPKARKAGKDFGPVRNLR